MCELVGYVLTEIALTTDQYARRLALEIALRAGLAINMFSLFLPLYALQALLGPDGLVLLPVWIVAVFVFEYRWLRGRVGRCRLVLGPEGAVGQSLFRSFGPISAQSVFVQPWPFQSAYRMNGLRICDGSHGRRKWVLLPCASPVAVSLQIADWAEEIA